MLWASRHSFRFCALATMASCRPHPVSPGRRPESPLWVPRRRVWRDDFRVLCGVLVPGTAGDRLLCIGGEPVRPGGPWSACAERKRRCLLLEPESIRPPPWRTDALHLPASAKSGGRSFIASARGRRANGGPAGPSRAIGYAAPGPPLDPGARSRMRARARRGAACGRAGRGGEHRPGLRALTVYLLVFQHVPVERCRQLIEDVTGAQASHRWVLGQGPYLSIMEK
jgi:hypothetical protein